MKVVRVALITLGVIIGLVVLVIVGGFILISMLANAVSGVGEAVHPNTCAMDNPNNEIEKIGHFALPQSAHLVSSDCWGMQDWSADATFTMTPDDLDAFIKSTTLSEPLSPTGLPDKGYCPTPLEESMPHLVGEHRDQDFYQYVVIDTSNAALYTVYVCTAGG